MGLSPRISSPRSRAGSAEVLQADHGNEEYLMFGVKHMQLKKDGTSSCALCLVLAVEYSASCAHHQPDYATVLTISLAVPLCSPSA